MSVCKEIKGYTRRHERLADFFALLAVALFFTTLYLGVAYHSPIINWMLQDAVIHFPIGIAILLIDLFLIFMLLNIGASRFSESDESCFATFKGRRAGTGSVGMVFSGWLRHMEHVGRKHR
jgi:hypothetical protein